MATASDIWSINPSTSSTYYRAAAAIGSAGSLTLLKNDAAVNGAGYLVSITSDGNDVGLTFTITGIKVGDTISGKTSTENVTGPNTTTVTSTNYWAYVSSISVSGTSVNNVSIGTSGSLVLPRTRLKAFYVVCGSSAGSLDISVNGSDSVFNISTPAGVTITQDLILPGDGILTAKQSSDYSVVTATNLTDYTLFCG